jgi:hypothetical protein
MQQERGAITESQVQDARIMATLMPVTLIERRQARTRKLVLAGIDLVRKGALHGDTAILCGILTQVLANSDASTTACAYWRSQMPVLLDSDLARTMLKTEDERYAKEGNGDRE